LKKEYFFLQGMKPQLLGAVMFKPESLDLKEKDKGNTMRVDIYYSKDAGKAYMQLLEYVPHQYNPCTKMMEYDLDRVNSLI
jgi:hypothetical protein